MDATYYAIKEQTNLLYSFAQHKAQSFFIGLFNANLQNLPSELLDEFGKKPDAYGMVVTQRIQNSVSVMKELVDKKFDMPKAKETYIDQLRWVEYIFSVCIGEMFEDQNRYIVRDSHVKEYIKVTEILTQLYHLLHIDK